jgi:hypothetical protein
MNKDPKEVGAYGIKWSSLVIHNDGKHRLIMKVILISIQVVDSSDLMVN